eukprot:scaffold1143_cov214-Chaetoceros_neogracile.AAC.4
MSDETKRLEKIIPNILAQARIKLNLERVDISHLELFSGDPSDKFWTTYVMSLAWISTTPPTLLIPGLAIASFFLRCLTN